MGCFAQLCGCNVVIVLLCEVRVCGVLCGVCLFRLLSCWLCGFLVYHFGDLLCLQGCAFFACCVADELLWICVCCDLFLDCVFEFMMLRWVCWSDCFRWLLLVVLGV